MNVSSRNARAWSPAAGALALLVVSIAIAGWRNATVNRRVDALCKLSDELNQCATLAKKTVRSPEELQQLHSRKSDLDLRLKNATMPGLVQAELMAAAGKAKLDVREIQPLSPPTLAPDAQARVFPMYRVSVSGTYRRIATYMTACKDLRVPSRVRGFRVSSIERVGPDGRPIPAPQGVLTAEIMVEAFVPPTKGKGA